MEVSDGSAVCSSIDAMEKEVYGVLLVDDGIAVLPFAVFYKTAAGGVGEGWVGGTAGGDRG